MVWTGTTLRFPVSLLVYEYTDSMNMVDRCLSVSVIKKIRTFLILF
jgi:hypothetical protein